MAAINILKFPVSSPADTSPLRELPKYGYDASQLLGVIGKSEGNGCVNDFSRTLSAHVWEPLLPSSAIMIFSGGTEGVLTPHVTFVVKDMQPTGLVGAVGRTRILQPHEIGRAEHARQVATTVARMIADNGLKSADVRLVLIKCPLLTSAKVAAIKAAGEEAVTADTYDSMAKSRYASAVGIAAALGEIDASATTGIEDALARADVWCSRASCSSGAELEDCHILLIASAAGAGAGPLSAVDAFMKDAIDARTIVRVLDSVERDVAQVVQVFVKAEADPTGCIRGQRHTMNTDSDIHSTRHARAAVGGLLCGLTGDTMLYVSGGAEGQGPPGGGSLCVIFRRKNS